MVFHSEHLKNHSLNDISILMQSKYGVSIRKQSLHERFNAFSVEFLKQALECLLKKQLKPEPYLLDLQGINRILIKDSVCFQVDESLAADYPGSGGSGSKASVRIQFEYDLLNGIINDLSLNAFNNQDASNSIATLDLLETGDLVIRDLAYVGLNALKGIIKQASFFLCRVNPNTNIYEYKNEQYVKLKFKKIRQTMEKANLMRMEQEVYLGEKEKLKTRLVIHRLPADKISERLRKARENNRKKGRGELSQEFISRAHLNLFVTNTDASVVPDKHVWKLYRLRWQIELTFKVWKSICHIEKVKKVKKHRLECYIYSKLILIALGWNIVWATYKHLYSNEGKVLSFFKSFKTLLNIKLYEMRDVFLRRTGQIESFMDDFVSISRSNHLLEKKGANQTSLEILMSCE